MNNVMNYTKELTDKFKGVYDEVIAVQMVENYTFLSLFEDEIINGNDNMKSKINSIFSFKEVSNNKELMISLLEFIENNPKLVWLEDTVNEISRLDNENLFVEIRDYIASTTFKESSSDVFKAVLEAVAVSRRFVINSQTASSISLLASALLANDKFKTLYDPAIGTGSLIYEVSKNHSNIKIYGQEINHEVLNKCRKLFTLEGRIEELEEIEEGHVITEPKHLVDRKIQTFDCVVCNPPVGLKEWGYEQVIDDTRFHRGLPPRLSGDYAFITHVVESISEEGKALMILSPGSLFREGREGEIRKQLVEENLIETVISLPGNMLYGTGIPVNIIIFNKNKAVDDILFINATSFVERNRVLSTLSDQGIKEIANIYQALKDCDAISKLVPLNVLQENRYNLTVERYVVSEEVKEYLDLDELRQEYEVLTKRLERTQEQLKKVLY